MTHDPKLCSICRTPLDLPGRPWTENCGGDCLACMADVGDPECVKAMKEISWKPDDTIIGTSVVSEIDNLERQVGDLSRALDRAHTILSNMAAEHTTGWRGIFARWPIHHEPLRNDARRALPQIRAALNIEDPQS